MSNVIAHQGVISSINGSRVFVKIIQTSACVSCSVKGHCSAADSKDKLIEIHTSDQYKVGDIVEVYGEASMGMKAVLFAFIIPFLVLVITLFVSMYLTNEDELLSVGCSLALLTLYYVILSANKRKFKKEFSFKIKSINN